MLCVSIFALFPFRESILITSPLHTCLLPPPPPKDSGGSGDNHPDPILAPYPDSLEAAACAADFLVAISQLDSSESVALTPVQNADLTGGANISSNLAVFPSHPSSPGLSIPAEVENKKRPRKDSSFSSGTSDHSEINEPLAHKRICPN